MVSSDQIKTWVLESLEKVKAGDSAYEEIALSPRTPVLGTSSAFASIAITAFATDLEEKIEDATGETFIFNVEEICALHKGKSNISVEELSGILEKLLTRMRQRG